MNAHLDQLRRSYAEELRHVAFIENEAVVSAFATVAREHFLMPGPWLLFTETAGQWQSRKTEDDDPRHLYRNVVVSIFSEKLLNNGLPSLWASLFDKILPSPGEHVFQIGAGTGYYTAILAALVGETGRVTAVEIDPEVAPHARVNLAELAPVTFVEGDGAIYDPGPFDVLVVCAGVTHPLPLWFERLRDGGRALIPLSVQVSGMTAGSILRLERHGAEMQASFLSPVMIYPCAGGRDPIHEAALAEALRLRGAAIGAVRRLRREAHAPSAACWFHTESFCLSG